jgi:hypothetical protein
MAGRVRFAGAKFKLVMADASYFQLVHGKESGCLAERCLKRAGHSPSYQSSLRDGNRSPILRGLKSTATVIESLRDCNRLRG